MGNTVNIAVVDDLARDRETVRDKVLDYAAGRGLPWQVTMFSGGEALLADLTPGRYDVVFLDIVMGDLDGIETARRLRQVDRDALLVFITTEADYALEGYEVEAAGFLLKEESESRFRRLMERLERRLRRDEVLDFSPVGAALRLPAGDLLYAEVLDHDMALHTREGIQTMRMTMEELKPLLPRDGRFFECHRGIMLNLDAVAVLGGQVVTMENGDTLPVSRRRRSELERAYAQRCFARVRREF